MSTTTDTKQDVKLMSNEKELKIEDVDTGIYLTLKRSDFDSDKEKHSFIKNVERLIRSSKEYKEWIKFVKYTLENDYCFITKETDEETKDVEIHHHPFSLYDLVEIVVENKIMKNEEFTSFEIAQEVMELHFKLKVGFIPLLHSMHKKYHNGYLKIPIELVQGDYQYIMDHYTVNDRIAMSYISKIQVKLESIDNSSDFIKVKVKDTNNITESSEDSKDG